jgi:hypothetical protein
MQIRHDVDQAFAVVGARTQHEHNMGVFAIGLVHQCRCKRRAFPHKAVAQHGGLPSGRPGRADRAQQRNTRLVLERESAILGDDLGWISSTPGPGDTYAAGVHAVCEQGCIDAVAYRSAKQQRSMAAAARCGPGYSLANPTESDES